MKEIQNNQVHLCLSCSYSYPKCPACDDDVAFGDGKGKDNICCCNRYEPVMTRWRKSMPDQLPKTGKEVIVCDSKRTVTTGWIVELIATGTRSFEWSCFDDQLPITHWMPLPEPPKEEI